MEPAPVALELRGIAKVYGRTAALKTTTLSLSAGEVMALLGPNGSGKTTLLKIVAGAITPSLGAGSVFGHDLVTGRQHLRVTVGLLATDTYLYDDLTALENLKFAAVMAGRRISTSTLRQSLQGVDLHPHSEQRVRTFSSGMKRRLSLARTLILDPRLLLLDEPYNSLDVDGIDLIDEAVRRISGHGGACILATHDTERALSLADRVAVLRAGALTHLGPAAGFGNRYVQYVG